MSVGFTTTKGTLDTQSGSLAQQIGLWARSAANLQTYLLATPDSDLELLGYTPDDVALLKSGAADMAKLAQIYAGQAEQTPAYDFRTFTARIAGLQI